LREREPAIEFIEGDVRTQGTLFPVSLEEFIPDDHFCRVIDAFADRLDLQKLGFVRAEAAETGRPGHDPRDLDGYLEQIRGWPPFAIFCKGGNPSSSSPPLHRT
jgi:hypothetical protein